MMEQRVSSGIDKETKGDIVLYRISTMSPSQLSSSDRVQTRPADQLWAFSEGAVRTYCALKTNAAGTKKYSKIAMHKQGGRDCFQEFVSCILCVSWSALHFQ